MRSNVSRRRAPTAIQKRLQQRSTALAAQRGSYPGYIFNGEPLKLASGHFGLGHGSGVHAPDEYYVIEASNPKLAGLDGAVKSYVEFLYSLA